MRKYYWWLVCRDENNRPYLVFGSDKGEGDARQKGLEMLGGVDFEIKRYPTRDRNEASAYFRGKRLEQGEGIKRASQRVGRNKSLVRMLRRRH